MTAHNLRLTLPHITLTYLRQWHRRPRTVRAHRGARVPKEAINALLPSDPSEWVDVSVGAAHAGAPRTNEPTAAAGSETCSRSASSPAGPASDRAAAQNEANCSHRPMGANEANHGHRTPWKAYRHGEPPVHAPSYERTHRRIPCILLPPLEIRRFGMRGWRAETHGHGRGDSAAQNEAIGVVPGSVEVRGAASGTYPLGKTKPWRHDLGEWR